MAAHLADTFMSNSIVIFTNPVLISYLSLFLEVTSVSKLAAVSNKDYSGHYFTSETCNLMQMHMLLKWNPTDST